MLHLALALTVASLAAQPELANLPHPDPAVVGVEAATQAYLDTVPPEKRARSDAYFEGGYWLMLWRFLWSSLAMLVLLHFGLSARLRDAAARITARPLLQPAIYWVGFTLFAFLFALPLSVYADFIREHQYALSTQTLGAWFADTLKTLGLELVLGAIGVSVFYAALRRTGARWWLWGTGIAVAFLAFTIAIAPVYIAPLFNTFQPLKDPAIREPILTVARANGIQANEVWEMDASRQTTRTSANVSGMFGTERITLNDNLLRRASRGAVLAVMGHEMAHYVLNHGYEMLLSFGLVIAFGFAVTARGFPALAARYGGRWRARAVDDPAGLPLIVLIFGAYFFLMTPVTNSIIRSNEYEADVFGLHAAKEPEGFVEATLLLAEYRKLHPGRLEEILFYDHPSGYTRIYTAMRWKAEQRR
ncbi:MAG TPA: M48 family metallopeptidase [Vicinamibacterales bacterium]|nr:M48 family metallopeptidase [Vicinamibacterales bacterium]